MDGVPSSHLISVYLALPVWDFALLMLCFSGESSGFYHE